VAEHSDDTNVQRAARLDTTAISDALDRLGIAGQCLNIKPLDPRFRLTGRAFTILYGPAGNPAGTVGDYIDDVRPGSVVVHRTDRHILHRAAKLISASRP